MYTENITFVNKQDLKLSAKLDLPLDKEPKAYALFAHFFTGNKNFGVVRAISNALTSNGIAVFRFDFTGLGRSEGKFEDSNFTTNIQDLISAAEYLTEHYECPKIVVGHSLGGAAAVFAAKEIDAVEAVITIGAPSNPSHVEHLFEKHISTIETEGQASFYIGGQCMTIKKQFLDDIESKNMTEVLRNLRKPILVFHSPQDLIVEIENAAKIYGDARHPKSFVSIDGADHLLTKKEDALYVGNVIYSWVSRYVNLDENNDELATDSQVAVRIDKEKYTTEVRARNHAILADEPKTYGGKDLGMSPYELLLSSLGTCTAMTLRMYADRKDWDLQEVTVHLSHDKIHAADCAACNNSAKNMDVLSREIEIKGNLDDKQRVRLMEIADKCPVHRTLENKIEVTTSLRN
ncbi:MAG: alpha/beta fold hydrolase [Flavobacteriaceae bacterium]|nr:alpha/beta fold hydrolase [Flavobacteriaceae bacterium]